ncbi:MAG: sugar transferase, partial [Fimbriimonadaceae bacterium]|nr:sugar transferase [Fimbriimonadaceae bacterium]
MAGRNPMGKWHGLFESESMILDPEKTADATASTKRLAVPDMSLGPKPRYEQRSYQFMKRVMDIVLGVGGLVVLSPIFFLASLAVVTADGFPIFYWSERVGQHNRRFRMMKFRTMVRNADEVLRRDPELYAEYLKELKLKN